MASSYIKKILEAHVYDVALESPISEAHLLSKRLENQILIKREDLQPVHSFKLRGAYNKIVQLSARERSRGVIAASAGNHAQGVALAAAKLGISATIVMPRTTPEIKVTSVRERGSHVVLHGDTFDEACAYTHELRAEKGSTFIHPYDDPEVIAGQGTIGMEVCRQHPDPLHAVFVPVGGGGLIAGIATYLKYVRPEVRVIGVESEESACLAAALRAGRRVTLPHVGIFADGVAVAQIGKEPFRLARQHVDSVITVSTDEICAAVKDLFDDTRSVAEPAGALALAGLKRYVEDTDLRGAALLAIHSGANVNFDRLRHIAERAELGERREAIFAVTIPERPGSFRAFCQTLGHRNITEFNYRYADAASAEVFVGVELKPGAENRQEFVTNLEEQGYTAKDLTDNEIAKLHIRYMVGGRAAGIADERVYTVEFPERPGALMRFLSAMQPRWNISMFHYRNHGSDYGRVFLGLQVPSDEEHLLNEFLNSLGYHWTDESGNMAYKLFLSSPPPQ